MSLRGPARQGANEGAGGCAVKLSLGIRDRHQTGKGRKKTLTNPKKAQYTTTNSVFLSTGTAVNYHE